MSMTSGGGSGALISSYFAHAPKGITLLTWKSGGTKSGNRIFSQGGEKERGLGGPKMGDRKNSGMSEE